MDAGKRPAGRTPDSRLLILCFTAGVLAVHALADLPPAHVLLALALPALLPWRWRLHYALFALGVLLTCWRAQGLLDARWPESRYGEELTVSGRVASLPEHARELAGRNGDGADTWRFVFEPADGQVGGRVRVSWYRSDVQVKGGECWRLRLRLRTPHGSLNPGGFDYEGWLFRQRIVATATVRDAERCEAAGGYRVLRWRQALRDDLQAALDGHPATGLFVALALGDSSGLTDRDWDLFRITGTSHLVAISGLNIAIVAGLFFFLCRWLWSASARLCLRLPAQKFGLLASAVAAAGYALLAGFEPPVVRALLMLWVVLAAAWLDRLGQASRALALAWLAILLFDPFAVLSPGLWLSFGAVAAIFYLTTGRLAPVRPLKAALRLQLLLSLALAPLTLYYFHGLAWAAPLVNLAAVPLFTLLTPVVLAAVLLLALAPGPGAAFAYVTAELLRRIVEAMAALTGVLPAPWLPWGPPVAALLLAMAGTLLLFAPRGLPVRWLGLLCFVPLAWPPGHAPQQGFELAALDVGQGLAVVVRTAHHALLFDAGPAFEDGFDAGESVVAPYLLQAGVHRLDVLMLSHGDNDHAGGVPAVRRLLRVAREIGTDGHEPCVEGLAWDWDGVHFQTLHPDPGAWRGNNGSCVLRVASAGMTALLPGDIEAPAESRLLRDHAPLLPADVLLAPHHGSKTSSTDGFVAAVAPRVVVFSAGWHSAYGHPRPEVVARYRALGSSVPTTGAAGTVTVRVQPGGPVVELGRARLRRFWNAPPDVVPTGSPPE
ncbi:MAG TPA: DNA internalization-related competence protein ComEC/Rec2 [Solimonas sp.]|nr:DNA internalization-related competence protein ComEC/Rec2 [Solimonas sp.]